MLNMFETVDSSLSITMVKDLEELLRNRIRKQAFIP